MHFMGYTRGRSTPSRAPWWRQRAEPRHCLALLCIPRGWHRCMGAQLSHSLGSSYSGTGHHPFQDGQSSSPIYRGEREAHGVGWGYCPQSH